jgi:hypothetical protein
MIFFLCFGFVAFVPDNPETPTVSHSFPKVCAALQKRWRGVASSRWNCGGTLPVPE